MAEADRVPVTAPQGGQAVPVAAAGRGCGLAGHAGHGRRVPGGVAARLAPGPAVPGRDLRAADDRGVAGCPGDPGAWLAGRGRSRPGLVGRWGHLETAGLATVFVSLGACLIVCVRGCR